MRVVTYFDLVVGTTEADVDGPEFPESLMSLPVDRLRVAGDVVIDMSTHTGDFFIDASGTKHVTQHAPGWQALACDWDAPLVRESDVWREWTEADYLKDVKAAKRAAVNALRDLKLVEPLPYAFPDNVPGSIDLRDARDLTNLQALVTTAQVLLAEGSVDHLIYFRDAEDQTHPLTPAQTIAMGMAVTQHQDAIYRASWAHKDTISSATTSSAVAAIDISTGWPV